MLSGLLLIDKELEWTSHDVVAKSRGILQIKKIGHAGTLDPLATGLLILAVRSATKQIKDYVGLDKEYLAEIRFGASSVTDDAEGPITETDHPSPARDQISDLLDSWIGDIDQMPPQYSAKKVNGKRAYAVARAGGVSDLKTNIVKFYKYEILDYKDDILKVKILVGSGFYVRSLARDLGDHFGCGGYLSGLRRTRIGDFDIANAKQVSAISENSIIQIDKI